MLLFSQVEPVFVEFKILLNFHESNLWSKKIKLNPRILSKAVKIFTILKQSIE